MVDLSAYAYPVLYAAIAGIGVALVYVLVGSKIRQWLHRTPAHTHPT